MLSELHIQNIAVIQKASIPFKEGLNVFTGETGAGKTILISAIDAVLGERTSRDIIRAGEEKAQVSAFFRDISPRSKEVLENMGYEIDDDSVLIFREITSGGRNTCRINGMPANVSILKEISDHLINIHGQRDTGQLLSKDQHLKMIDNYGSNSILLSEYRENYDKLQDKKQALQELDIDEAQKIQRIDMLTFQIKDIESANLTSITEEDDLLARRRLVSGSEKVRQNLSQGVTALYGGELPGIEELFDELVSASESLSEYLEEFEEVAVRLQEIKYELADTGREFQLALESLDFDPQELDEIERRLDEIYKLKRKYGSDIEEVLQHYENITEELESLTLNEERKAKLEHEVKVMEDYCGEIAAKLSKKRAIACKSFIKEVEERLAFLDMPSVKLSVAHERTQLTSMGTDSLEFMIVTNPGEEPKPLGRIASGGELARIMLAIKDVLADKDDIDTLIFDEIDTGVSGKAAGKIGRKLSEVSKSRQVICVTHLAQVAAFADNHLYIYKTIDSDRTYTKIDVLDREQSVEELARITSGEVISPAALESARELINRAKETS